ncbi:MAG: EamA family transporter [Rhodocyclaceae bacterium]|jgi:transporter family protein|nr:EamA family transporter [Rhodocyclaceae bacterium]
MSTWILPALACLAFWGVSRFLPKLATRHLDPHSALLFEVMGEVLVALAVLASLGFKPNFDPRGASYALAGGMLGGLGVYAYLLAAQRGHVSQLVVVTALYPVITVALGVLMLGESMNLRQGLGMGLGLLAILLVAT